MARLIDADALKEEVNKKKVVGRFNTILLIDNAPTVPDRYNEGYAAGAFAVLQAVAEENEEDNNG